MEKEKKVINYYVLCNKLKNVIRTGRKDRNVQKERLESVAEHIFWVQMLAIAMKSEYHYDIDMMKVIFMIAIHELWETIIWDLTEFQVSREEKIRIEHDAVHEILKDLIDWEEIEKIFLEFDAHQTKEANFAYQCDKLECDLQCKLYDEEWCVDLSKQESCNAIENERVQQLLKENKTWSEMWLEYDKENIPYDENFKAIINYALSHKINN
jgi:putative hydrolase of HD superfamily